MPSTLEHGFIRPPPHGKIQRAIWAAKFIWANPCNAPGSAYLEALPGALARVAIDVFVPSNREMVRRYLKPKRYGRPYRWPRKGEKKRVRGRDGKYYDISADGEMTAGKGKLRFPDPAEWLADKLPGRSVFADRFPSKALERWIWAGIEDLEHGLWYFVIADAAIDGLYQLAYGVYKAECFNGRPKPIPLLEQHKSEKLPWVHVLGGDIRVNEHSPYADWSNWGSNWPYAEQWGGVFKADWQNLQDYGSAWWVIIRWSVTYDSSTKLTNPPFNYGWIADYNRYQSGRIIRETQGPGIALTTKVPQFGTFSGAIAIPNLNSINAINFNSQGWQTQHTSLEFEFWAIANPAYS